MSVDTQECLCVKVLSYRASPRRSPNACGCWVCKPGGSHRLVYKPPAPPPRSAVPGTGCTEQHTPGNITRGFMHSAH